MHFPAVIISIALTASMALSCGQQGGTTDVDPELGQACFEMLRATLPIGTQYEGIEAADADRIRIRIMDGAGVTTVECGLKEGGMLRSE